MEVVKRHWIFIAEFLEVAKGGKQKVGKCTFTETWVKAVVGGWPGWRGEPRHSETHPVFRSSSESSFYPIIGNPTWPLESLCRSAPFVLHCLMQDNVLKLKPTESRQDSDCISC